MVYAGPVGKPLPPLPGHMFVHAAHRLNRSQLEHCCRHVPHLAIEMYAPYLNKKLFREIVKLAPWAALGRALDLLSPSRFAYCIRHAPEYALRDPDVMKRISIRQYDSCVRQYPEAALEFTADLLSSEQIEYCCIHAPIETLQFALDKLTQLQRRACCRRYPFDVLHLFRERTPIDLVEYCYRREPTAALLFTRSSLTNKQVDWCIMKDPLAALRSIPEILTSHQLMALVSDYRLELRQLIKREPYHDLIPILNAHRKCLDKKTWYLVEWALKLHIQ